MLFTILTSTKIYSQNFDTVVIRYHKWGVEPTHIVPCIKFEREYGIKKEYKITEKALTDSLKNPTCIIAPLTMSTTIVR